MSERLAGRSHRTHPVSGRVLGARPYAAKPAHRERVICQRSRIVHQLLQQPVVAGRAEPERNPYVAVLGTGQLPPATLEVEEVPLHGCEHFTPSVSARRYISVDLVRPPPWNGAGYRNRTGDIFFTREVLYRLS